MLMLDLHDALSELPFMLRNFTLFSHSVNPDCLKWLSSAFTFHLSSFMLSLRICFLGGDLWVTAAVDTVSLTKLISSHEQIKICFVKSLQSWTSAQIKARALTSNLCSLLTSLLCSTGVREGITATIKDSGAAQWWFPPFAVKNSRVKSAHLREPLCFDYMWH